MVLIKYDITSLMIICQKLNFGRWTKICDNLVILVLYTLTMDWRLSSVCVSSAYIKSDTRWRLSLKINDYLGRWQSKSSVHCQHVLYRKKELIIFCIRVTEIPTKSKSSKTINTNNGSYNLLCGLDISYVPFTAVDRNITYHSTNFGNCMEI